MSKCRGSRPHHRELYARLAGIVVAVGAIGVPATARAQLSTVTIAATDAAASEIGPDTGTFTITRTGSTAALLTVFYTISGTATNNGDYTFINSSVNIPAGQPSAPVVITPLNDPFVEGDETVMLTLNTNAQYAVGVSDDATVTIADNAVPVVSITATDPNASEIGPNTSTFTISRVGDTTFALTVFYAIGGTATNNGDYTFINSSVNIPAGQPSVPVVITPVNDPSVEGDELVTLTLNTNAQYAVGANDDATVTIADNAVPVVSIAATDANASEIGPNTGSFTISRVGDTTFALTVFYTIAGTATHNGDYAFIGGSVNVPAGQPSVPITITPAPIRRSRATRSSS